MLTMTLILIAVIILSTTVITYAQRQEPSINFTPGISASNKLCNEKVLSTNRDEYEQLAYLEDIDWHIAPATSNIAKGRVIGAIKQDRQDSKEGLSTEKQIQREMGKQPTITPTFTVEKEAVLVARVKKAISFIRGIVLKTIKTILKLIHMKGESTNGDDSSI